MPDSVPVASPTPTAPESSNTQPAPTPQPAPAPSAPPNARAEIYQRYYGQQEPQAPTPDPAPEPQQQPAPAPVAPDPTAALNDRLANLESLIEKLSTAAQPTPQTQSAQPQQPEAQPSSDPAAPADWLALLQQGKIAEAETVMANKFSAKAKEEAITQALEMFRVETEINSFLTNLRGENQDLLPFEKWIAVEASELLNAAQTAGKIKSTADYINQYKTAVTSATANARNLVQQYRAAGKDEAMTSKREVLASSTIPPSPMENRAPQAPAAPPAPMTPSDYLAQRQARLAKQRGMV